MRRRNDGSEPRRRGERGGRGARRLEVEISIERLDYDWAARLQSISMPAFMSFQSSMRQSYLRVGLGDAIDNPR